MHQIMIVEEDMIRTLCQEVQKQEGWMCNLLCHTCVLALSKSFQLHRLWTYYGKEKGKEMGEIYLLASEEPYSPWESHEVCVWIKGQMHISAKWNTFWQLGKPHHIVQANLYYYEKEFDPVVALLSQYIIIRWPTNNFCVASVSHQTWCNHSTLGVMIELKHVQGVHAWDD